VKEKDTNSRICVTFTVVKQKAKHSELPVLLSLHRQLNFPLPILLSLPLSRATVFSTTHAMAFVASNSTPLSRWSEWVGQFPLSPGGKERREESPTHKASTARASAFHSRQYCACVLSPYSSFYNISCTSLTTSHIGIQHFRLNFSVLRIYLRERIYAVLKWESTKAKIFNLQQYNHKEWILKLSTICFNHIFLFFSLRKSSTGAPIL